MNPSRPLLALATSLAVLSSPLPAQTLKVFLLAGQSNMQGQAYTFDSAQTASWNIPTMEFLLSGTPAATDYLTNMPFGFKSSLAASWMNPRTDAWCVHYDSSNGTTKDVQPASDPASIFNGTGPLSPGFGAGTNFGSMFGAELAMGTRIADATTDPVFLFKSDQGGTTLAVDWRPPGAVAARGGVVGPNYTNTMNRFAEFLDALDADLLDDGLLNNYGNATDYEICGFFWLQGFNDGLNGDYVTEYGVNLIDLVRDVRAADSRIPADLPCIVIESSDQNETMNTGRTNAVATLNAEIPGSAAFFESENMINNKPGPVFWGNNPDGSPFSTDWGYHFHARAENFLELGWIAGGAVLDNSWLDASDFWLDRPEVGSVAFNQAGISTAVNAAADTVTVYWGTTDSGPTATGWDQSASLGAQAAGAIATTLTGLVEDTTYSFRVHATSTALSADSWSAPNSFTTPLEFPLPALSVPAVAAIQPDGATVESTLSLADADVTLVWALSDVGTTDVATWTSASGGDSFNFGSVQQDDVVSHAITGLDPGSTYYVRLLATNANGEGWSESASFTTSLAAPVLTAYYDFEGTGADRFEDPAGAFADNLIGGQASAVFSTETAGAFAGSQSISFDGSYTLFTDAYTTDLGPGINAMTIMFWIKATDAGQENNNTRLITTRKKPDGSDASNPAWQIEGFGNNGSNGTKLNMRANNGIGDLLFGPNAAIGTTGALANTGQTEVWHHVALVWASSGDPGDGGAYAQTYLDGVSAGIVSEGASWDGFNIANPDGQLIIGGAQEGNGSRDFTGLLDDVALFAGVVEEADIAAIAAGTLSPADFLAGGDPFSGWATSGTVTGVTFDGDANSDGVQDGLAFLLGAGTPDIDANGLLPTPEEDGSGGLQMSFTMLKPANSAPAVLSLEHSGDLGVGDLWASVAVPAATDTVGGVSFTVTENAGDPTKNDVIATIPSTGNALDGKLFGRLAGEE